LCNNFAYGNSAATTKIKNTQKIQKHKTPSTKNSITKRVGHTQEQAQKVHEETLIKPNRISLFSFTILLLH
jgi:hypothetical protein